MSEQLIHANCGGNITQDIQTEIFTCDKCEESGIAVQHTTAEREAIILKQSTEAEIEKIEQVADDHA
jgi:hypothetical protein